MNDTKPESSTAASTDLHENWSPEERHARIAEAAYLRAAARGFAGGDHIRDWLDAEAELRDAAQKSDE